MGWQQTGIPEFLAVVCAPDGSEVWLIGPADSIARLDPAHAFLWRLDPLDAHPVTLAGNPFVNAGDLAIDCTGERALVERNGQLVRVALNAGGTPDETERAVALVWAQLSADGRYALVMDANTGWQVLDAATLQPTAVPDWLADEQTQVVIAPDGAHAIWADADDQARLVATPFQEIARLAASIEALAPGSARGAVCWRCTSPPRRGSWAAPVGCRRAIARPNACASGTRLGSWSLRDAGASGRHSDAGASEREDNAISADAWLPLRALARDLIDHEAHCALTVNKNWRRLPEAIRLSIEGRGQADLQQPPTLAHGPIARHAVKPPTTANPVVQVFDT